MKNLYEKPESTVRIRTHAAYAPQGQRNVKIIDENRNVLLLTPQYVRRPLNFVGGEVGDQKGISFSTAAEQAKGP